MSCTTCFEDFIAKCNLEIQSYLQLAPLTDYKWVITDRRDLKYQGDFTTDADGFWVIPVDQLPPGLLTEFSGLFTLEVQDLGCKPVKFKAAQEFYCAQFTIKGGTYEKNTLGCDFTCSPAVGSQTGIFPFTSVSTFSITWTPALLAAFGNSPSVQVYHLTAPDTYQLVDVTIEQVFNSGVLQQIDIDNGGVATGYVLIS